MTARATDAKRDEVLTLMAVAIQHGGKHLQEIVYEFLRRWLREHIVATGSSVPRYPRSSGTQ